MPNLFLTADEHHGHRNIIEKFQFRPFENVDQMTEELISRHNFKVGKSDRVIHIGDMFWRHCKDPISILKRLNGQHHYVMGNHEEAFKDFYGMTLAAKFVTVTESYKVDLKPFGIEKVPYLFCAHFAHRVWPKSHNGSWHAYGHSHGALPDDPKANSMDVGVDTNDYFPYSIEEFAAKIKAKEVA